LGQGEGFSAEFLDYPGQTTLVKWKEIQVIKALQLWCLATRHDSVPTISFGRSCLMEAKCNALDETLCAVSGDLTQMLVLLEYYKTESNMYRRPASNLIANLMKATALQANTYLLDE
jgi:hypothetical protein